MDGTDAPVCAGKCCGIGSIGGKPMSGPTPDIGGGCGIAPLVDGIKPIGGGIANPIGLGIEGGGSIPCGNPSGGGIPACICGIG